MGLLESGLELGASVVNGISNYIGQTRQIEAEKEAAAEQRAWNEAMMDKQNEWSLNMWNKTNEYNDPSAQVKRLRDAGLNPLYYGLDGSSANGMQSAQALGYDRASMAQMANPLQVGAEGLRAGAEFVKDLKAKQAQIDNLNQDTAKKGEETATEVERRQNIIVERDKAKNEIDAIIASKVLTEAETEKLRKDVEWYDAITEAELAAKDASAKLNDAQRKRIEELLPGEKELQQMSMDDFYYQWQKIASEIAKSSAEITKLGTETELTQKDIENYALNHMSNGFGGTGVSIQNIWRQRAAQAQQKADERRAKQTQKARAKNLYGVNKDNGELFPVSASER